MNKKQIKTAQFLLFLLAVSVFVSSCFWYGPRRRWHDRWHDGGGWHEGYYER